MKYGRGFARDASGLQGADGEISPRATTSSAARPSDQTQLVHERAGVPVRPHCLDLAIAHLENFGELQPDCLAGGRDRAGGVLSGPVWVPPSPVLKPVYTARTVAMFCSMDMDDSL